MAGIGTGATDPWIRSVWLGVCCAGIHDSAIRSVESTTREHDVVMQFKQTHRFPGPIWFRQAAFGQHTNNVSVDGLERLLQTGRAASAECILDDKRGGLVRRPREEGANHRLAKRTR